MHPIHSVLSQRLQWLSERATSISENIAGADLPGQKRSMVKPFHDYLRSPDHATSQTDQPIDRNLEMLDLSRNSLEYEGVASLAGLYFKLIKTASSRNA